MRRAARTDKTAADLVAAARKMGALYLPWNGVIDGVLLHRGRVLLIDWKSKGGELTPAQGRLVAAGWPIYFISTIEQLQILLGQTPRAEAS